MSEGGHTMLMLLVGGHDDEADKTLTSLHQSMRAVLIGASLPVAGREHRPRVRGEQ
jgi:hypothetical protein